MKIENRIFPYPVFGINQPSLFSSTLTIEFKKTTAIFRTTHTIDCDDFSLRIKKKDFSIVAHIYCSSTYFRESYVCKDLVENIEIKSSLLNDVVDVSFFICAQKDVIKFSSKSYVPPFNNISFDFLKGDILAYSGKSRIVAKKSPEQLKSVSSFMKIDSTGKKKHPMYLDYSDDKLILMLSDEDYRNYQLISEDDFLQTTLHGCIVLPALSEAIRVINEGETTENIEDKKWFIILNKLIRDKEEDNPLSTAQKILDLPINRTFTKQKEIWLS